MTGGLALTDLGLGAFSALVDVVGMGVLAYAYFSGKMKFPSVEVSNTKTLKELIADDQAGFREAVKIAMRNQENALDFLQYILNSLEGNAPGSENVGNKFLQIIRKTATFGNLNMVPAQNVLAGLLPVNNVIGKIVLGLGSMGF